MIYDRLSDLPSLVRTFLYVHDGFVVGSYANYLQGTSSTPPDDIDIIVPPSKWSMAMKSIPKGSVTNTFGGVKITIEENGVKLICDVWSQDISDYLTNLTTSCPILHPKTNTTLLIEEKDTIYINSCLQAEDNDSLSKKNHGGIFQQPKYIPPPIYGGTPPIS